QARWRCIGDVEDRLALAIGRLLQRAEVVLGLARAARTISGAGEDVEVEGRIGQAPAQPTLELAGGGADDDREVLEVIRTLTGRSGVVSHSVVSEVDGLPGIAEDAIGGDRVAEAEVARAVAHHDARPTVVGDEVARAGRGAANRVVRRRGIRV